MNVISEGRLKVASKLALVREDIHRIHKTLEQAPHYLVGHGLMAECKAAIDLLDKLEERLDQKLVVTLVGPSGAGKSTLLNALAGEDDLSPTGLNRPTTRKLVVYCRNPEDAASLFKDFDSHDLAVESRPASGLEHLSLVDTPDMDSTESSVFHPLLEKILQRTDILICVFNAENPKRRDTVVFLKRFVDLFPGLSLFVVLNRSDRLPEEELKAVILPDLRNHLEQSWKRKVDRIFCLSARRHLQNPGWLEDEQPLHDYDEFLELRRMVLETLNRSDRALDARLEQAGHLQQMVRSSVEQTIRRIYDDLTRVKKDIERLEMEAMQEAQSALKEVGWGMYSGLQALFYQKLSERWWGPVGWLAALWTRFLMAGAGLLTTLRSSNPVLQLYGLISSLVRYQKTRRTVEEATTGGDMGLLLLKYRLTIQRLWPDLAERLISLGFSHEVRQNALVLRDEKELQASLSLSWKNILEEEMDRRVRKISSFFLQLVFNLPTLGILGLFAFQSLKGFLRQEILPSAYFLHATVSIVLVALLSFFFLQILVRFVGGWNLMKGTIHGLYQVMEIAGKGAEGRPIIKEIEALQQLTEGTSPLGKRVSSP